MERRTALIFGVTGKDGACLAELLLRKGFRMPGLKRRSSLINTQPRDRICQDTLTTIEATAIEAGLRTLMRDTGRNDFHGA
ncbi:GDP-mannose 4,6-dehydratase [Afifella sp. IM 167]|uniref:GDP-mannose 4,6-dehydratase n=1 Tax=Afifella sp. IM 167 TaxID=2033586 RepID=UPI00351DA89F